MSDPEMQSFEKACQKVMDAWLKDVGKLNLDLTKLNEELAELEGAKGDGDKDKLKDLKLQQADLMKIVEKKSDDLGRKLLTVPVPEKAPVDLLKNLPDIVKKVVKAKGIPLSDNLTLIPDLSVDLKNRKIKEAGVTLKWEF
jgi:hypothetical protein